MVGWVVCWLAVCCWLCRDVRACQSRAQEFPVSRVCDARSERCMPRGPAARGRREGCAACASTQESKQGDCLPITKYNQNAMQTKSRVKQKSNQESLRAHGVLGLPPANELSRRLGKPAHEMAIENAFLKSRNPESFIWRPTLSRQPGRRPS